MEIRSFTIQGKKLKVSGYLWEGKDGRKGPSYDLLYVGNTERMTASELMDALSELREEIDDLIFCYSREFSDDMIRTFERTWGHTKQTCLPAEDPEQEGKSNENGA